MKATIYPLLLLFLLFAACERQMTSFEQYIQIDEELIQQYLEDENIDAEKHESGLHYKIITEGNGARPNIGSEIQVSYVGKLLDGSVFDEADTSNLAELPLANSIRGWQIGIPLIKEGGEIQLFVPSRLGYGSSPRSGIPPYSVLVFDVKLHRVK